mgnify:CR=1 FL=1
MKTYLSLLTVKIVAIRVLKIAGEFENLNANSEIFWHHRRLKSIHYYSNDGQIL